MRFGLFGSAQARRAGPDTDSSQGYREFIENNIEAEALGFYSTFLVEHHFTGFGQVSATLNLLTWLGARTRHLRLGTAVMVLPWHNPVLLAEQAATLDLLSGGRLDFGVGKGYRYNEFAGFCIDMAEAEARFEEALQVITQAFTANEPFSHHGKYWRFDNIVVEPPSAQKPHPPFWMGAGSANSVREVAERGYNLLLGQYAPPEEILEQFAQFAAEVRARRRPRRPYRPRSRRQRGRPRAPLSGAYADQRTGPPSGRRYAGALQIAGRNPPRERRERAVWHPRRNHRQARTVAAGRRPLRHHQFRRFAREHPPFCARNHAALRGRTGPCRSRPVRRPASNRGSAKTATAVAARYRRSAGGVAAAAGPGERSRRQSKPSGCGIWRRFPARQDRQKRQPRRALLTL
jgi:alkanesulfonate monooxygenase SsuD/methylene tetrahydromethanopterin reductase-like flavin-dependent oxidoreductase (luciferase family)